VLAPFSVLSLPSVLAPPSVLSLPSVLSPYSVLAPSSVLSPSSVLAPSSALALLSALPPPCFLSRPPPLAQLLQVLVVSGTFGWRDERGFHLLVPVNILQDSIILGEE